MITPAALLHLPIWASSRPRYITPVLAAVTLAALACSSAGPSEDVPTTAQPATDAPVTATAEPTEVVNVVPDPTATSEPVAGVQEDALSDKPADADDETAKDGASDDDGDEPLAAVLRDLTPAGPKDVNPRLFQQLLPRDAIFPIYEPTLGAPEDAPLDPEELVIGVSLGGEARAYPIRPLRFREMVNDELGGVPILVTW
jgi:hypothetical protein